MRKLANRRPVRPSRRATDRPARASEVRTTGGDTKRAAAAPSEARPADLSHVLAAPTRGRVAHDVFGVDRGLYVLRTPVRPIGLDGDAPGSGPRVEQVE